MINMRDYGINLKKQQENQIKLGKNKEALSKLTSLNTFQTLETEQKKVVTTTFINLNQDEKDK